MRRGFGFTGWIVTALVLALVVRWTVLAVWFWDLELAPEGTINDNLFYHRAANLLADGEGFVNPFLFDGGISEATAAHPPGFTVFLGIFSFLGFDSVGWHRIVAGLASASVVVPVGLLVRRAIGDRAAVLAMLLAAVHPPLWMNDGLILSESLYIPVAAWALFFAHRVWEDPTGRRIAALSVIVTVAAYTRGEAVLLFVLMVAPLIGFHPRLVWRERIAGVGLAAGVAALLLAPWVIRNMTTFDEPTFMAAGAGYVLEIGNCDRTYAGEFLGYWHTDCDDGSAWPDGDESVIGAAKAERGREYIADHLSEQPKVIAARVGRLFGLFRPLQSNDFDVFFERRVERHVQLGLVAHYGVMAAALYGASVWRRGASLLPLLAVLATVVIAAGSTFGIARYRVGADVVLVVLAAVAVDALWSRYRPAVASDPPVPTDAAEATA